MKSAEANARFLENLYQKGPFEGHGFVCKPNGRPLYEPPGDYTIGDRPIAEFVPAVVEHYRRQWEWLEALGDHAVPMAELGCGTHLYAAAFGCRAHTFADSNPCALPLVFSAGEADRIEEPEVHASRPLARVFELAAAVQEELGPNAYLGPPDLQSGFDTASLVWNKEDLLVAMRLDPGPVHRLVAKCANLLRSFLAELRREFPTMVPGHCPRAWVPPQMGWWVSNDECGAFGTGLFEEFCLPELIDLSATFGGIGMHCCADAEHQFESFKRIPGFYAFNRVAASRGWDPLLEHFDGPDSPVHVLGWLPPKQMGELVHRADPATRFIFVHGGGTLDEARAWLDQVAA